ncbi:DsrE family protein [Thiomicrorhabdus sp.]|uniref:DsrE family protein n=1 Tax=Thiomicrorhabdus sp. TaxID=2039724 RepID=UPI002AA774BF|nr:DsrE family protein [Thiomicrorhabdus sp.]
MINISKFLQKLIITSSLILISSTAFSAEPQIIKAQLTKNIKVVYDINENAEAAGIGKGLYYVRGLIEAYKNQGISPKDVTISVVVHGDAGYWLLNDEAYQNYTGNPFDVNPNAKVVKELQDYGVSVELCHVTMKAHHWTAKDILPGVKMVFDAYTRIIDLQQHGYSYIKFT